MDTLSAPVINFPAENPLSKTLVFNTSSSLWTNQTSYVAVYNVLPAVDTLYQIDVNVTSISDFLGNDILENNLTNVFYIHKKELPIPIPIGNSDYFGITVFPNPIQEDGHFSIAFSESIDTLATKIVDLAGKEIQSHTYYDSQFINLQLDEPGGVYLLMLRSGNKEAAFRLIKK